MYMADVCWSALRGRQQFFVESIGVVVVGSSISVVLYYRGHGCGNIIKQCSGAAKVELSPESCSF